MRFLYFNKDVFKTFLWYVTWPILWISLFFKNVNIDSPEQFLQSFLNPLNVILAILSIVTLVNFLMFVHYHRKAASYIHSLKLGDWVELHGGRPRAGKTATNVYEFVILSFEAFYALQADYLALAEKRDRYMEHQAIVEAIWTPENQAEYDELYSHGVPVGSPERIRFDLLESRKEEMEREMELAAKVRWTTDNEINYQQLLKAYRFAVDNIHDRIPCGFARVKVRVTWRKHRLESNPYTPEMAAGLENQPRYSVIFDDEMDNNMHQELYKYDDGTIKDQFKYGGQNKITHIGNAQNTQKIYNEARCVAFFNEIHESQKAVCKPAIPTAIYKALWFLKSRYIDRIRFSDSLDTNLSVKAPKLTRFLKDYNKWLSGFGFRKITVSDEVNSEVPNTSTKVGKRTFVLTANLNASYDSEASSELYPSSKEQPIRHEYTIAKDSMKLDPSQRWDRAVLELMKNQKQENKLNTELNEIKRKTQVKENTKVFAKAYAERKVKQQDTG